MFLDALVDVDTIHDDRIFGELGDDFIDTGAKDGVIYGEEGGDAVLGQASDDWLQGDVLDGRVVRTSSMVARAMTNCWGGANAGEYVWLLAA